jgi:hypothetical protein
MIDGIIDWHTPNDDFKRPWKEYNCAARWLMANANLDRERLAIGGPIKFEDEPSPFCRRNCSSALAGWWTAFSRQIPFVFEVRDLWPESLAAVGVGRGDSLVHHALAVIARFLYERTHHIVVVSPAFKDRLIEDWRVPAEKDFNR